MESDGNVEMAVMIIGKIERGGEEVDVKLVDHCIKLEDRCLS